MKNIRYKSMLQYHKTIYFDIDEDLLKYSEQLKYKTITSQNQEILIFKKIDDYNIFIPLSTERYISKVPVKERKQLNTKIKQAWNNYNTAIINTPVGNRQLSRYYRYGQNTIKMIIFYVIYNFNPTDVFQYMYDNEQQIKQALRKKEI